MARPKSKHHSVFIATRCSRRLKQQMELIKKHLRISESEVVRAGATLFFEQNPTREEQFAAIMRFRMKTRGIEDDAAPQATSAATPEEIAL